MREIIARRSPSQNSSDNGQDIALDIEACKPTRSNKFIDWRLVILGSLLPDIIDKPLGTIILSDTFSNGRILAHTLLFSLILLSLGILLYYKNEMTGVLVVALCSMVHLVLDSMWRTPQTLFWPFKGWTFPKADIHNWIPEIIESAQTNPSTFIPEIIGISIIVSFLLYLLLNNRVLSFIKTGRIAD